MALEAHDYRVQLLEVYCSAGDLRLVVERPAMLLHQSAHVLQELLVLVLRILLLALSRCTRLHARLHTRLHTGLHTGLHARLLLLLLLLLLLRHCSGHRAGHLSSLVSCLRRHIARGQIPHLVLLLRLGL
jgi:hypothetical protein